MLDKFFFISSLMSSFIILCLAHNSHCLDQQKGLLLQLKNELIFTSSRSTKLVQWNQTDDHCKWYGVECDGTGYVVSLQLDGELISGGIGDSSSLFKLEYLENLNLANNEFNDSLEIPRGIHNLTHLTHLVLSNAGFVGQVPAEVSSLMRLVRLDISNNNGLKLEHPNLEMLLQNLTKLRQLYLDEVYITSSDERRKWSHIISSYLPNLTALSLISCSLSGPLASSFWQLHSLSILRLNQNDHSSVVPDLFASFPSLATLSLVECRLKGSILDKIFRIPTLQLLDLSWNKLTGTMPLSIQTSLSNLVYLNLRGNLFSGNIPSYVFGLPSLQTLVLHYNRFTGQVEGLPITDVSNIVTLDLSHNRLEGPIPDSFFWLHSLECLQLNGNMFSGSFQLDKIQSLVRLTRLDLSGNNLSVHSSTTNGQRPLSQLTDIGLASCNLSVVPDFIKHCDMTSLDLSNNGISGDIQNLGRFLCNSTKLDYLDLSMNKLSGTIPPCLLEKTNVLRMGQNDISGFIPDNLSPDCRLAYLDLSNNALEGKIPRSIENCKRLKYMNARYNMINDTFPCMLPSTLIVLVLRSNRFHGEVKCTKNWPFLQVVDISLNNFSGRLESIDFSGWSSMAQVLDVVFYAAHVSITMKGLELNYSRIWPNFCIIDMSSNNFRGELPNSIGDLSLLHHLNLSHNALTGSIPESFGNLREIEALDLSQNQLVGKIPTELWRLEFLQVLNVSYNELVGEIPKGRQLQTFSADSFKGNPGLCGFNINVSCTSPDLAPPGSEEVEEDKGEIKWEYASTALGYVVGLGSFVWLLVFCRSFRHKYFGKIDEVIAEMFDARDRRRRRKRQARARATRAIRNGVRR